jgi:hypothetical protein
VVFQKSKSGGRGHVKELADQIPQTAIARNRFAIERQRIVAQGKTPPIIRNKPGAKARGALYGSGVATRDTAPPNIGPKRSFTGH